MPEDYQIFLDDYFEGKMSIQEILNLPKYKDNHFIFTLKSLVELSTVNDQNAINKTFGYAEEFDRLEFNPLAKMIFYLYWCHASMWKGLKRQTEIIIEKARRLNPPNAPPILLSTIEITAAYASGSAPAYMDRILVEYKKYGHTSPKYQGMLDNYFRMKCGSGMGVSISKSDHIIEKYKNKISNLKDLYFYQFTNDLSTCDFDSINSYFHKINQNDPDLSVWLALYFILTKKDKEINIDPESTSHYEFFLSVLKVNKYLISSEIEKATAEMQLIKNGIWGHVSSNFLRYTQLRIELCNKNVEAAFQLLKSKIAAGEFNYMNDFFFARVELLLGNREKAFQYFRKCFRQCEYYMATNRINVELDIAYEIKRSDLFYIAKILDKADANEITEINYDEILTTEKLFGVNRLIGESDVIKKLKGKISSYADTNLSVLITGETGAGKEIVAKALHEESPRKNEPFLAINCGSIADSLLQSELFGHLAGSYTGAISSTKGIFQEAGKGTVFLDEIGEISQTLQVALLRVLENNEVRPVGGSNQVPFHCRVLFATNANLELLVVNKVFREDLYYRLKRLEIEIAPLRERKIDIIPLVNSFLKSFRNSSEAPTLSEDLKNALCEYDWPGNIRQLKNEIEKMDLIQSRKSHYELADCEFLMEKMKPKEKVANEPINVSKIELKNEQSDKEILTTWRRIEKIKNLFTEHKDLTRKEIASKMQISLPTATEDLKKLLKEKYIIKIEPSTSPRSHYFILNNGVQ